MALLEFANRFLRVMAGIGLGLSCRAHDLPPGTSPLTLEGDLSAQMVEGIDRFLQDETERAVLNRAAWWRRDLSSIAAYENSVRPNRERFRRMIGAVDPRLPVAVLEFVSDTRHPARVAETDRLTVFAVRWPVFENVYGEGLWLRPKGRVRARIVAIPDADQTPEMAAGLAAGLPAERQFARRLAEHGCEVLVPVLLDRRDAGSGNAALGKWTNQPHREWIYRQAFELGRHVIGYEVQKVMAAVDFFASLNAASEGEQTSIGVMGYAEGGLIGLYAAALDTRIRAALVSGYFDSRQHVWQEPIYRNLFGLLREFGDAEIAGLIAPRCLVIEHSPAPAVNGPPPARSGRSGAAPGRIETPAFQSVAMELERARARLDAGSTGLCGCFELVAGSQGRPIGPGSEPALLALLNRLGVQIGRLDAPGAAPLDRRAGFDPCPRQERQLREMEGHTQLFLRQSERARKDFFWSKLPPGSTQDWRRACAPFRSMFEEESIGRFPISDAPADVRARRLFDRPKWTGYEVVMDVFPSVFAWGYLLIPKDLEPGQRRPAVVCQHGLEGLPASVIDEDPSSRAFGPYQAFAARLAERGYVVFAPHSPYRGGDRFRVLQRKANPLGKSIFSIIIAQHRRALQWLGTLPCVDAERIGFYGLSYGGKTAMRVPAVVEGYALSICSGDFNEWIAKNVSTDFPASYMFTGEYEIYEWNLGPQLGYAEMAALIAPRPFMVERGHRDGVAIDEWVAYEYAKVRRLYAQLGIGERTAIEYFDGPHQIHGVGTFEFLDRHLRKFRTGPVD
ncbi:MAG TPA: dienelactone hydrolase family protein [Candidatus Paceibacterota bacterium]|nr:dienelactone hydrolase family protein [Verrucomicrobiota bacterium]HOX03833.1 dienelactone hydrolase family protein [Verrucomicrobiota bacterium]HRZ47224.1 dienelactone hydrolase family protein [Candidatus Paceibacterota bacterium]